MTCMTLFVTGRYLGEVTIAWHHNHPIIAHTPLSCLRVTEGIKQIAERLFKEGLTPAGQCCPIVSVKYY